MDNVRNLQDQRKDEYELCSFYSKTFSLDDLVFSRKHLQTLMIIGQSNITSLTAISELTELTELWIVECGIKEAPFLENNTNLVKLYLYSNELNDIPDLKGLTRLKTLFLSNNNIRDVKALGKLISLEELNFANNKLERIPKIFPKKSEIIYINFAGNPLSCLTDVKNLSALRKLQRLVFSDPLYDECPLTVLCNYRFYVINCLSRLKELDHYIIYDEEREWITYFFKRQTMYYNMLLHKHFNAHIASLKESETKYRETLLRFKQRLHTTKKKSYERNDTRTKEVDEKEKVAQIESEMQLCKEEFYNRKQLAFTRLNILRQQLITASEYCGNIDFLECDMSVPNELTELCERTLQRFFCRDMMRGSDVINVKLCNVTKVTNKAIDAVNVWYNREDNLKFIPEKSNLAIISLPGVTSVKNQPINFLKTGLLAPREIKLANCLAIADAAWSNYDVEKRRVCMLVQTPVTFTDNTESTGIKVWSKHENKFGVPCLEFSLANDPIKNPIFLVEYKYIRQEEILNVSSEGNEAECIPIIEMGDDEYQSAPNNNDILYANIQEQKLLNLEEICLSHQNLRTIDRASGLPNLKKLDISYNRLTAFPSTEALKNLSELNISFNNIETLNVAEDLPALKNLNLSWNLLSSCLSTYNILRTHIDHLHTLDISNNPFQDVIDDNSIEYLSLNYLTELQHIHGNACGHLSLKRSNLPCSFNFCKYHDNQWKCLRGQKDAEHAKERPTMENIFKRAIKRQELCAPCCLLTEFSFTMPLSCLIKLNLMGNLIKSLDGFVQTNLPVLKYLDLTDNLIASLQPMGAFHSLQEFYCGHNGISEFPDIDNVKSWQMIRIIDLHKNPIEKNPIYKTFLIFHLPKIKYISDCFVQNSDIIDARCTFGNTLDKYILTSLYTPGQLENITQLSMINCCLKKIDLSANVLPHLESLDLSKNQISSLWGVGSLRRLRTLCLSYNCLEAFGENSLGSESVFPGLVTLFLDHNSIKSVQDITRKKTPIMKHLFLNHNSLQKLDDVGQCSSLETLILDHNEIHTLHAEDFCEDNGIRFFSIENNKIRSLEFLKSLTKLEKLYLCGNSIENMIEMQVVALLKNLQEFTIEGNPVQIDWDNSVFENFELKATEE